MEIDNWEAVWHDILAVRNDLIRSDRIPPSLENFLLFVGKSGNTVFPWHDVRCLFRLKLLWAIEEFGGAPLDNEKRVLQCFDSFQSAPFTIQRFTELVVEPQRYYRIKEKFLRAVEKTVKVISTIEPAAITWGQNIKEEIDDNEENHYEAENGQRDCTEEGQNKEEACGVSEKFRPEVHPPAVTPEKTPSIGMSTLKTKVCNETQGKPKPCICFFCEKHHSPSEKLFSKGRIHSGKKVFECSFCDQKFRTELGLKWHKKDKHPREKETKESEGCAGMSCECLFCRKPGVGGLKRSHSGGKIYFCGLCEKRFRTELVLKWHMESHSKKTSVNVSSESAKSTKKLDEGKFICSFCNKTFKHSSNLKSHERTHTGERPFTCTTCGKQFTRQNNLDVHLRTHTGERPFCCATCGKRFTQQRSLGVHLRIHTGERPFTCTTCGKRFTQQNNLDVHLRTHTGERPFTCTTCGKRFTQQNNLDVHLRTHTGERPFSCPTCGKQFTDSSNLRKHERIHT